MMESIRELREKTHLGMTECKNALTECGGDVEKAVQLLLSKGALKKANTILESREGVVRAAVIDGGGRMVEVNCQTDFAARSELFDKFVTELLTTDLFNKVELGALDLPICAQLREAIVLKRKETISGGDWKGYHCYNHHNGKISVLLNYNVSHPATGEIEINWELVKNIVDDVAMQVAANKPIAMEAKRLAPALVDSQKALFEKQLKEDPKTASKEAAWPKIIEGKLNKWYSEVCLMQQESLTQAKKTIAQVIQMPGNAYINLAFFKRFELGE